MVIPNSKLLIPDIKAYAKFEENQSKLHMADGRMDGWTDGWLTDTYRWSRACIELEPYIQMAREKFIPVVEISTSPIAQHKPKAPWASKIFQISLLFIQSYTGGLQEFSVCYIYKSLG